MFTVVIPTFNRPQLLRQALISVAQQTCKTDITKVIVSENGLNRASESVCQEFPELTISYVYQEQQLPVVKHLQYILSLEQEDYVALLCDDDWWDIHHLELAKQALLVGNNKYVAYFGNFIYASNSASLKPDRHYHGTEVLSFGQQDFVNYKPHIYTVNDLFVLCLMITPFHFSSLICKGDVLTKSVAIFNDVHATYADRALYPVIATYGDVIFNPLKTVIVLWHQGMDTYNYNSSEWGLERYRGSAKIIALAIENDIDINLLVNDFYKKCTDDEKKFISVELMTAFPDRQKLSWFIGVDEIHKMDIARQKESEYVRSIKYKVKAKLRSLIK